MSGTNPNPYSLPSQPHPNSPSTLPPSNPNFNFPLFPVADFTSDHELQARDADVVDGNSTLPHNDGNVDAETVPVAPSNFVDHQQHIFDSFQSGLEDWEQEAAKILVGFLNGPNTEIPSLNGSTSLDFNRGDERGEAPLKRQTVDYLGFGLPMEDNVSPKRIRNSEKLEIGNQELGFEFERHDLDVAHSALSINGLESVASISQEEVDRRGKRKLGDSSSGDGVDDGDVVGFSRFNREENMKEQLIEIDFLTNAFPQVELLLESDTENWIIDIDHSDDDVAHPPPQIGPIRNRLMERFRNIAKASAHRFARYEPDVKDNGSSPEPEVEHDTDEGPTPFSTAVQRIKDQALKKSVQTKSWVPKRNQEHIMGARFSVPSLKELCLKILANHADAIVSLEGVPDYLRHRLSQLLCDSRKMSSHFFELLLTGSPTEIRIRDCSWLPEEQFTKMFHTCDTANLEVLQLDRCGRCIPDYALRATLAQSPSWLPRLTTLSLSGACRLSDKGLRELVSSAPVLRSINISQCSLLTSASLDILADSFGSLLKELYLDDCQNIDAAVIVPALKKLEHLEVLSLAGIQTVSDVFIKDFIIVRGHNMKELVLKDCIKLTDASVKVIAGHCPRLCVLDLVNVYKLTDLSIRYLSNSCQALHTLKLCRTSFSDEAIAAFVEITGASLEELSLNNIKKVGHHTAISLASYAKKLHTLDLSWCRNLTDNELGLIVDSCLSLRSLKLFGCTQVTDVFMNGYSNPDIRIIGLKMSPLLQHVKVPDPHQGALRYSPVSVNLI